MHVQPRSHIRKTRLSALVLASAVGAVALPHAAFAQSRTFTGTGDGTTYTLSTNWSPADVPDTTAETAIIDAGGAFNVTLSTSLSVGGLTIGSNDSLTQANNTSFTITGVINNAGSFVINSGGNLTDLFVSGATLNGGGTLTLKSADRIRGSGLFTNNSTIQGDTPSGGSIGANELSITNSATGLINANVSGSTLDVDPAAGTGTFINAGTLRASNGGTLQLNGSGGGTFANSGGTIQAQTGSTVTLVAGATVTGGTLTTVGTGTITASNATIAGLTNSGSLVVANNTALTLSGTITNNGTILGNSGGNLTDIITDGANVTLNGSGTVTLQSADRIRGGATLTNNSTIQGETSAGGSIGANELSVTNSATGLINANVSGLTLVVDPAAGTSTLINAGTLRASNGGVLQLSGSGGGTFANTGGTIQAQNGSSVTLVSGAAVTGGTLTTAGTGTINTSNATLVGLINAGSLVVANNTTLTLSGTITNNGTILANSIGNLTDITTDGTSATLNGSGTVTLQSAARIRGGGTFTNNSTIQGETSSSGSIGANDTNIVNHGTINANSATGLSLVLDPLSNGSLVNTATLQASGGGRLVLTGSGGGDFANTGGTIQALAGSIVRLDSNASVTGGTLGAVGTGVVETNNATLTGLTTSGTVNVLNNTTLTLVGTVVNNGAINFNSIGNITELFTNGADVTLSGSGTVNLTSAARIRGGGTFTNNITLQGDTNSSTSIGNNDTTLVNNGLIIANNAGTVLVLDPGTGGLTNNGTLRASGTGTLLLTGSGGGAFTNTGHVIEALAGSQVRLNASASITGGTLSSVSGGTFSLDASSAATLANLTNASALTVGNNATLTLVGTINNTASITFASVGNFTDLNTNGADVTLTGGGTVNLTSAARIRGGGTFTNSSNTIQGDTNSGSSIGNNDTTLVNNALINANNSGAALVLDPGTGGLTNTSNLQASNGGVLVLTGSGGGAFTNTGGTIQALNGSQVQLVTGASVTAGTISSTGTGTVLLPASTTATLNGLTINANFTAGNTSTLTLVNTVTNNGTMLIASGGNFTDVFTNGANVTLAGTGTLTLQTAARIQGGGTFTNNSTIQGETSTGSVGSNNTDFVNNGLFNANSPGGAILDLDPSATLGYTNSATGTTRASGGGTLRLNGNGGGSFTNNGIFEALNASTFTFVNAATLTNSSGGTLTGGIYRSIATNPGGSSTLNLPGGSISVNAADVTLSGPGSVFTQIDTITQTTSAGKFRVLDGRNFTTVGNYTNTGITQLGGGTFTATGPLNNLTTGETFGFGSITNRIVNSGLIRAAGGVLSVGGIDPATTAGTARVDAGSTLTLSVATADSTVNVLDNNGNLNVGGFNLLVRSDYTNANFGSGNSFNPRANVTGGQIQASPAVAQTITGATNGTTATPTIALGNIRTGTSISVPFSVNNVGASGPSLRGAIQTTNAAGFGGNITDGRLSGTGTAAGNFGPIAPGSSTSPYTVIFNGTTAGALTGQKIAVVNNFDNVAEQQISVTGAAYNPAIAGVTPPSVFVGNFHVGDVVGGSTITFANLASPGAFSEDLGVTGVAATGTAALGAGSPTSFTVLAGANNTAVKAGVSTATAGAKSGNVTANLLSNATVNAVAIPGLSPLSLGTASVGVTGNVFRLATATTTTPVNLGDKHVGDAANTSITVNNTAAADGFSESLSATASVGGGDVTAASGATTIAPGANSGSALTATLSTATAGARSGTVNIGLTSIAGGAGLGNTILAGQTATVTGNVYNLAVPVINNSQPVAFGIVHVGDVVTPVAVSIKNNAPAGSFSEKLNAAAGTPGTGLTGTGTFTGLAAQGTNASGITVGINTASAAVISSNLPISFASDGTGINSLGLTTLAAQTLSVTAQVNNFAVAKFNKVSGSGTFTGSGASYSLDLGSVPMNSASPQAQLGLLNNVLTPADTLAGGYTIVASNFITSGFTSFTGLTAGSSLTNLLVGLNTSTVGSFTGTITLAPRSQNTSGYDGALSNVVLNLQGVVTAVPEPTTAGLIALAGGLTLRRQRRD
ncbi:MAG: hypothetical protein JWM57_922 [Phycisphaerales bacterium]|nr:hypothetical protein [Phycisphaerales bacterium]